MCNGNYEGMCNEVTKGRVWVQRTYILLSMDADNWSMWSAFNIVVT